MLSIAIYSIILILFLDSWNSQRFGCLGILALISPLICVISIQFGLKVVYAYTIPVSMFISLIMWWCAAQLVKPFRIRLVRKFSLTLILIVYILFVIVPVVVWGDWKIAAAFFVGVVLATMRAGAVSTDKYVIGEAKRIQKLNPNITWDDAIMQAEQDMRFNVDHIR